MKKKKSISRKTVKQRTNPFIPLARLVPGRLLSRFLGRILLVIVLVGGGFFLIERVSRLAQGFPVFTVYPEAIRCISRPAWLASSERLTSEVLSEIHHVFSGFPPDSIFDDKLERTFQADPSSFSPWIESIETFERIFPSRYKIVVKMRRPVAVFTDQNRSFFIDGLGVVIASVEKVDTGEIRSNLPVITGFGEAGYVREGRAALNKRLCEGGAVARELEALRSLDLASKLDIVEIDVSRYGNGKPDDVTLVTSGRVRILWGRSAMNARFRGIDPSPEAKAEKLEALLKKVPGLEGVSEVNVTFDKIFYRLDDGT